MRNTPKRVSAIGAFKLADKQLVITLGRRESSDKREPGEEEQDTLVA